MEKEGLSNSRYTGSFSGLVYRVFVAALLSVVTLGIAVPWAIARVYRWVASNATVNGRGLRFSGSGRRLFRPWFLYWIVVVVVVVVLVLLVFGMVRDTYGSDWGDVMFEGMGKEEMWEDFGPRAGRFVALAMLAGIGLTLLFMRFLLQMNRRLIADTHYVDGAEANTSKFDARYGAFLGQGILYTLRLIITLGIGLSWSLTLYMRWWANRTTIEGDPLQYDERESFIKEWIPYWVGFLAIGLAQSIGDDGYYNKHAGSQFFLGVVEFLWHVMVHTFVLRQIFTRLRVKRADKGA